MYCLLLPQKARVRCTPVSADPPHLPPNSRGVQDCLALQEVAEVEHIPTHRQTGTRQAWDQSWKPSYAILRHCVWGAWTRSHDLPPLRRLFNSLGLFPCEPLHGKVVQGVLCTARGRPSHHHPAHRHPPHTRTQAPPTHGHRHRHSRTRTQAPPAHKHRHTDTGTPHPPQ